MLKKYAIVIEKVENSYSAYVPDLPGCTAAGDTLEELQQMIQKAIILHLKGMRDENLPFLEPTTRIGYVEVEFVKGEEADT